METKIIELLENVKDEQAEIKVILTRNTVSLEDHIRRTEILEKTVVPLQERKNQVDGVIKLVIGLSVVVGIVATIMSIFK